MPPNPLSQEVIQFIDRHIHSIEQLEIFLALAEKPQTATTSRAVFQRVQSSERSITSCLKTFLQDGLVMNESGDSYRLADQFPQLPRIAADLETAYRERRVAVIELIYRKPTGQLQSFADAFKLRKDK